MIDRNSKKGKIVCVIVAIIGIGFLIAAVIMANNSFSIKNKVKTVGTVVFACTSDQYYNGYMSLEGYMPDRTYVEYTVEYDDGSEETIVSSMNFYSANMTRGKTINMYYIKGDEYTIGCFESDYILPIVFGVLGLFFFIPVLFINKTLTGKTITIGGKQIEKFKENSKCYICKIIDIKQDQFISIAGINPYILYLRDDNQINPVTYKSNRIFFDPSIVMKNKGIDSLKVYVNRDKPDKYMVDIEPITNAMQGITEQDILDENRRRAGISVEE